MERRALGSRRVSAATCTRSSRRARSCSSIATRAARAGVRAGRRSRAPPSSPLPQLDVGDFVAAGLSDGRVVLAPGALPAGASDGAVTDVKIDVRERGLVDARRRRRAVRRVSYLEEDERKFVAGQVADGEDRRCGGLDEDGGERRGSRAPARRPERDARAGRPHGHRLVGTDGGQVYHWLLGEQPRAHRRLAGRRRAGDRARLRCSATTPSWPATRDGRVTAWFRAPVRADGDLAMVRASRLRAPGSAVIGDRGLDAGQELRHRRRRRHVVLRHSDVGADAGRRCQARTAVSGGARRRRATACSWRRAGGEMDRFALANPHPEASRATLCSARSGTRDTAQPEYVWQSTGATDDFEPKLSLVPLALRHASRATFYALLFAIPLAVLGALYTSQFVHPTIRARRSSRRSRSWRRCRAS